MKRTLGAFLVTMLTMVLAGCSSAGFATAPPAAPTPSAVTPSPSYRFRFAHTDAPTDPSLVTGGDGYACSAVGLLNPVTGILQANMADPVWPVWLRDAAGRRLDVIWPKGFTVAFPPGDAWLVNEVGEVVATEGNRVVLDQIPVGLHTGTAADPYVAVGIVFEQCYVEIPASAP